MDTLPFELISTIFEWAACEPSTRHRTVHDVSHINRRLREVALASPLLWSSVDISRDRHTPLLHRSLERSKACPLDISIHPTHLSSQGIAKVLDLVGQHVARWTSFHLDLSVTTGEVVRQAVLSLEAALAQTDADILQTLQVISTRCSTDSLIVLDRLVAPRLHQLRLENSGLNFRAARCTQLRDLTLVGCPSSFSSGDLLSFLRAAPLLKTMSLVDIVAQPIEFEDTQLQPLTISLPHLTTLTAENIPFQVLHHILSSFETPALRILRLGAHLAPVSLDWSTILPSSLRNVEEFEWTCAKEPPSDLHAIRVGSLYDAVLRQLANAAVVKISSVVALGRLVATTVTSEGNAIVLPRLKDLELHGMKGCGLSSLVSLVEGRAEKLDRLSISARDFSTTASIGQRSLRAADEAMEVLQRVVGKMELRERQDHCAFRYTFLGWKDYIAHQNGRRIEYEQEYEE